MFHDARLVRGAAMACLISPTLAHAFCGTYVGAPGAKLSNTTSEIVLARSGNQTVLTMVNDFETDASDFALVIPVPEILDAWPEELRRRVTFKPLASYDFLHEMASIL